MESSPLWASQISVSLLSPHVNRPCITWTTCAELFDVTQTWPSWAPMICQMRCVEETGGLLKYFLMLILFLFLLKVSGHIWCSIEVLVIS